MAFSINFIDAPVIYPFDDLSVAAKEGFLEMEGGREYFVSSLYEWDISDYRKQWHDAITQLVGGREKVGLITSYVGPENSSYLDWWLLYRNKDGVAIQSQVLFYDQLPNAFSLKNLHGYIIPRVADGLENAVSEWNVSFLEVKEFLKILNKN